MHVLPTSAILLWSQNSRSFPDIHSQANCADSLVMSQLTERQ